MNSEKYTAAEGYRKRRMQKRWWVRVVSCLGCVVVFCTVYALILPAITAENTPQCGQEEHVHTEACFAPVESVRTPVCTPETLGIHRHTADCLGPEGQYICGYADFVLHRHDAACYDADGNLWCPLPEVEEHVHSEACYAAQEPVESAEPVHIHTEACYATEPGELLCTLTETEGHAHGEDCYDESGALVCQVEETAGHRHGPECYAQKQVLTCTQPTEAEAPAAEPVPETSAEPVLICGRPEIVLHQHGPGCYDMTGTLICGQIQVLSHQHTDACFQIAEGTAGPVLTCQLAEHTHTAECFLKEEETNPETPDPETTDPETPGEETPDPDSDAAGLTEEEQAQVDSVNALLAALPGQEEVEGKMAELDEEGSDAYLTQLIQAVQEAQAAYDALSETQREKVTGAQRLEDLAWLQAAVLPETPSGLEELGIYLGEQVDPNNDKVWVAYDTGDPATANVKVTITLPEGEAVQENCYPFVSEVKPGEEFYPTEEAIQYAVGEVNEGGVQCYKIHWVEVRDDGSYNFQTDMEMGNGKNASVHFEYLKESARLGGGQGQRKLRVFSSKTDSTGNTLVEISDAVTDVELDTNSYKGFTFNVTEPCPYVFLSKKVATCYVESLMISNIVDGSAPFDSTGDLVNGVIDQPGNDRTAGNLVVRSYDTITYDMGVTFKGRNKMITATEVRVYFEMTLRKSSTAARFDTSKMSWLNQDGSSYCIEYLDNAGNVIMVMDQSGKYYQPAKNPDGTVKVDRFGFSSPDKAKPIFLNARLNGSQSGADSYKVTNSAVAKQRLVGYTKITAEEGQSVLSGTQTIKAAIEVRNADNGEQFMPSFRLWVDGNVNNLGSENHENGTMQPAQPQSGNVVDIEEEARAGNLSHVVTVSAGTNFNLQLKKNTDMSYKNWFDFSTGQAVAEPSRTELVRLANLPENHGKSMPEKFTENGQALSEEKQAEYANYRYGRITCYGITLQLYNDTDNAPQANRAAKGLKGLSLPVGDITFDLNFWSEAKTKVPDQSIDPNQYTAILWDYNENVPANNSYSYAYADPGRGRVTTPNDGLGNGGRNLYWDGETRSPYAKGGAPSNYKAYHDGCYYGGDWAIEGALSQIANPTVVTGTGANATYHFKVSDYDFDFDNQHFPLRDAGNSGNVTGYDTYARCFSAGCVQVLSVFPMVQEVSEAEIFLNTKVSNLRLSTRAGQELAPAAGGDGISHEVNKQDNTKRDQIVLYAPGNLTKGSSFNGKFKGRTPNSTTEGFLGTEYWTTSYDCSAFAGDDIWIVSYGMMSSGGDDRTRSMNLLQLFDSRALSVRDMPSLYKNYDSTFDEPGSATFLYAADPDYPSGYDTNTTGVLKYMNGVREEDLVYFTSLDDLQKAGYTCVGVLMELRSCNLLGGKYQYMRIPVKVNGSDEDLVGKTVATVNTFRVWSYDLGNISWAAGVWDERTGKNTLANYPKPEGGYDSAGYSGELVNREAGSPPYYIKTEYEGGHQKLGTHAGGTLSGNSLLILSYKAHIDIAVDNKLNTATPTYNQNEGQAMVDYRLKNIKTELSDLTGQTSVPPTDLTIKVVLDEEREGGKKRISVFRGSYYMYTSVNAAQGGEKVKISDDPRAPTELTFRAADGTQHPIKVYAEIGGASGESVTFKVLNAPVGIQLPDIVFQAQFAEVSALKDNESIRTGVYISGQGDNRAYDHAMGNTDNITVHVALNGGTNLTKAVNVNVIELNGQMIYTITYTNSGSSTIPKMYLYDLLPANKDIRETNFTGDLTLSKVEVSAGSGTGAVYCSTTGYRELYETVRVFGGTWDEEKQNADGMNAGKVDGMLASGKNSKGEPLFIKLAADQLSDSTKLADVTGVYVVVENLRQNETFTLELTMTTSGNKGGDLYGNLANSWLPDSGTVPIVSREVQTRVVERSISGVVWYDADLDGARDDGETLLSGVTATLLKKGTTGQYEPCAKDVTGATIASSVTTGADGAYSFNNLAEGDYIVAFSGEVFGKYTGPTAYQQARVESSIDSDGVRAEKLDISGFKPGSYVYAIQYNVTNKAITMKPLAEITGNRQWEDHLDLGLVITGPELPMTGGSGTAGYVLGGIVLMAGAALWLARRRRYIKSCQ